MNDLLERAVAAHGGSDRWSQITAITAHAAITGALWNVKGKVDALKNVCFEANTKQQLLTMDFIGQDKRSVFEPHRVAMHRENGTLIDAREEPETSFNGHQLETPWDDLHLAYFTGEALWTYLNVPFLYASPGFASEEIAPIVVDGETWRRLKVTFPEHIKTHIPANRSRVLARTVCYAVMTSPSTSSAVRPGCSTPPTTVMSTASSFPPRDEATPGMATTS